MPRTVELGFAGHGMQINGQNYLVPAQSGIQREDEVPFRALAVDQILAKMSKNKTGLNLMMLDACRDNPFARSFRSTTTGLAKMEAPSGTLISYAAKPGTRSIDGTGHNGLYTSVLLKYLPIPGMPIEQMLKKVGTEVRQRSGDQQQTWMEGLLDSGDGGDFCFAGCAGRAVSPTTTLTPKPSPLASKPAPRPTPQRQPLEPATSSRLKTTKSCDICPEMVRLPGGSLRIGSPENESGRDVDEKQRTLTIGSFSIGKYEVTQAEWLALMGSNPSFFSKCENCPVEQVSWEDAQNYILKLNAQTGQSYRLPTEAEWEYACRAGGSHTYCGSDNPGMVAWYDANSGGETHPVGQKSTNGFGLFDMSGNVWELTCSYRSDAYNAVYDGTENRCKDDDISVVQYRGGSWGNTPSFVRSANRNGNNTGYKLSNLGFRLAHD